MPSEVLEDVEILTSSLGSFSSLRYVSTKIENSLLCGGWRAESEREREREKASEREMYGRWE